MSCAGCDARAAQVLFLQALVEKLEARLDRQEDRLLALANPAALAQARGEPAAAEPERTVDEHGVEWVKLHGRRMRAEDFDKMIRGEGVIDGTGQFIGNEELARAEDKLNAMLSGQPSQ